MLEALQQILGVIIAPLKALKALFIAIQDEDKSLMKQTLTILVIGIVSSILLSILGAITLKECITLSVGFFLWTNVLGFTTCDELFFSIIYTIKDLALELLKIIKPGDNDDISDMKLFKLSNSIKEKVVKQKPNDGSDWSKNNEVGDDVESDGIIEEDVVGDEVLPAPNIPTEDELSITKDDIDDSSLLGIEDTKNSEEVPKPSITMQSMNSIPVSLNKGACGGVMSKMPMPQVVVKEESQDIETKNISY